MPLTLPPYVPVPDPTLSEKMWHWDNGDSAGSALTLDPSAVMDNRIIIRRGGTLTFSPKRQIYVRDPIWVYNQGPGALTINHHEGPMPNGAVPAGGFVRIDYALGSLGPEVENYRSWVTHMGNPTSWTSGMEIYDNPTFNASHAGTVPFLNRGLQTITLADLSPLAVMSSPIHMQIANHVFGDAQVAEFTSTVPIYGPKRVSSLADPRFVDIIWRNGAWYIDDPAEATSLGRVEPFSVPPMSGKWTATPNLHVVGSGTTELDTLWLCPIYIRRNTGISEVSFKTYEVAGAGGIVRAGIWEADNAAQKPTGIPLQSISQDVTSGGNRWQVGLPATANVKAPLFYLGIVQQVASGQLLISNLEDQPGYNLAEDDGHIIEGDLGGWIIADAWKVTGVSGALPDLTAATFNPVLTGLPRHAVRFS